MYDIAYSVEYTEKNKEDSIIISKIPKTEADKDAEIEQVSRDKVYEFFYKDTLKDAIFECLERNSETYPELHGISDREYKETLEQVKNIKNGIIEYKDEVSEIYPGAYIDILDLDKLPDSDIEGKPFKYKSKTPYGTCINREGDSYIVKLDDGIILKLKRQYFIRDVYSDIVDACNRLKAGESLTVTNYGDENDLRLEILKDENYNPEIDPDYGNQVDIVTFRWDMPVDDAMGIYVTDGQLVRELERIKNNENFNTL